MKFLLEMSVPDWHEDNAPNHIMIVEASGLEAAESLATSRLMRLCRGPEGWKPSLEKYAVIDDTITSVYDFTENGKKPVQSVMCPCCKTITEKPRNISKVKCANCGCSWNPKRMKDE